MCVYPYMRVCDHCFCISLHLCTLEKWIYSDSSYLSVLSSLPYSQKLGKLAFIILNILVLCSVNSLILLSVTDIPTTQESFFLWRLLLGCPCPGHPGTLPPRPLRGPGPAMPGPTSSGFDIFLPGGRCGKGKGEGPQRWLKVLPRLKTTIPNVLYTLRLVKYFKPLILSSWSSRDLRKIHVCYQLLFL